MALNLDDQRSAAGERSVAARAPRFRGGGPAPLYLAIVIVAVLATFSLLQPETFPTMRNVANIATDASLLLILAVGMTFVIVTAGIDLSVASTLVFASVVAALAMRATGGDGLAVVLLGLATALASGAIIGALNGVLVAYTRVPALIVTLGMLLAVLGAARLLTNGADVRAVPAALRALNARALFDLPWLVFISLAVAVAGGIILHKHRFGRHCFVIGSDLSAAKLAGLHVERRLFVVYVLSGTLAGLAGFLSLARFATTTISGHPTDNLEAIAAVVLGGTSLFGGVGSMLGTVLGVVLPPILGNGLIITGVRPFWQPVVLGIVLIAAVYIDQLRRDANNRR